MPVIAHTKRIKRRRRRRLVPSGRRPLRNKSLYPKRTIYLRKGRFVLFKNRGQRARIFDRFNWYALPSAPSKSKRRPLAIIKKRTSRRRRVKIYNMRASDFQVSMWNLKNDPRFPKPTTKKLKFRQYPDTSRWNAYKNNTRAQMKPLGPKLIFELIPTREFFYHYGVWNRKSIVQTQRVMRFTREAMEKMLRDLTSYSKDVIGRYVPKETGDLRNAMIDSIKSTKVRRFSMKVELHTGKIHYANVVNKMPQGKVRHDVGMGKIGRRSHALLNDPKASHGYFEKVAMIINTKASELIYKMITDIQRAWTMTVTDPSAPNLRAPPTVPPHVWRTVDQNQNPSQMQRHMAKGIQNDMVRMNTKFGKKIKTEMRVRSGKESWEQGKKKPSVTYIYPKQTYKMQIPPSEDDWEAAKYGDRMAMRARHVKIMKLTSTLEYPRNTIKGFFKVKGLYKTTRKR